MKVILGPVRTTRQDVRVWRYWVRCPRCGKMNLVTRAVAEEAEQMFCPHNQRSLFGEFM